MDRHGIASWARVLGRSLPIQQTNALCYWIHGNILFLKMLARSPPVAVTLELTANHDPSSPKHIRKANYDP
ncbi:hypothetical protein GBA52_022524 [Prunus armeniaca]|nr:hypothetical protein GBA52_022524 [Prunus armeniaca]